jgi:hypothetical protein
MLPIALSYQTFLCLYMLAFQYCRLAQNVIFLCSDSGALLFFSHQKSIKEFVSRYSSSLAMLSIMFHIFFLPAIIVYYSVDSVTKPMHHLFRIDIAHMCHACEMWRSRIVLLLIASEWPIERGICDDSWVRMRFQCHNPVVLCCTIVRHVIGKHRGYAIKILFGLVACDKFMLCRSLLGRFRTYLFL